jgi:hypothetical protein
MPYAECTEGKCANPSINPKEPALHCTWGSPGANTYCTAFFQQFTATQTAVGGCLKGEPGQDHCDSNQCTLQPIADGGALPSIAVVSGGSSTCADVCQ